MRIKVVCDNPNHYQSPEDKSHLVGNIFNVIDEDQFGVYVEDNNGDKWLLNTTEYVVV
jgi:hypothetical protein